MLKPVLATLGLLALLLTACGSAADNPPPPAMPAASTEQSAAPAAAVQQEPPAPAAQQDAPAAAAPSSGETAAPQTGLAPAAPPAPDFDDARVEGLVAEWETDLSLIAQVAQCVEQALGLERPLRPGDFQPQANQDAIVACIAKEVGNE